MKYSLVMPTYFRNREHINVVSECLSSIDQLTDTEVIIVNDGSPIEWDIQFEANTYIRHRQNMGIACSWNDGIKVARGEYICVINDDITFKSDLLDKLRMALEDDDENAVAAPGVASKQGLARQGGIEEDYQWYPGYCFMMRKSTFDEVGLFDEQFSPFNYEDTDMWTRILKAGKKLVRNYSTTITHREGHVLHTLDYDKVSAANKEKFLAKHGFDPIPVFYEGATPSWQK